MSLANFPTGTSVNFSIRDEIEEVIRRPPLHAIRSRLGCAEGLPSHVSADENLVLHATMFIAIVTTI